MKPSNQEDPDHEEFDAVSPTQYPEDDPTRKKQDWRIALIASTVVILAIALLIVLWMFLF